MGETIFVRPVEGVVVQYPRTMTPLPKEGAEVPWDGSAEGIYWRRCVMDGSVDIVPATKPTQDETGSINSQEKKRR